MAIEPKCPKCGLATKPELIAWDTSVAPLWVVACGNCETAIGVIQRDSWTNPEPGSVHD